MTTKEIDDYDKIIIAFSGGKDSIACFLHLMEQGISKDKIELWHHLVDGEGETFFDWEVTEDYCRKFAKYFGVDIYFSWKEEGFYGEMMRDKSKTKKIYFETPSGEVLNAGGKGGKESTRLKFPQVSANLSVRWCSSYLKIDVMRIAINNQPRFKNIKTLVISGERAEESASRAKYEDLEPDATDLRNGKRYKRLVDRYRPIKKWSENQVWAIIEKYKVIVHPCYYMGWSRCSCKFCIFGNSDQFASAKEISPQIFQKIVDLEKDFDTTIKRKRSLELLIQEGEPYKDITDELKKTAISNEYLGEIISNNWFLPSGAYGEGCGPT